MVVCVWLTHTVVVYVLLTHMVVCVRLTHTVVVYVRLTHMVVVCVRRLTHMVSHGGGLCTADTPGGLCMAD